MIAFVSSFVYSGTTKWT